MNQCDGCKRGLPVENGIHVDPTKKGYGRLFMVCTKGVYERPQPQPSDHLAGSWVPREHGRN